jgi:hypothetical protein
MINLENKAKEIQIVKEKKGKIKDYFFKLIGYLMDGHSINSRVSPKNKLAYSYIPKEIYNISNKD